MRHVFLGAMFLGAMLACASTSALAGDLSRVSADGDVSLSAGYGLTGIRANEYVYEGSSKISQLNWKSAYVSTFTASVDVDLDRNFYLRMTGATGLGGNGHMADYDWLVTDYPWSDRSLHPDTRLNHYFTGSIEAGRDLFSASDASFGIGAGFKYTDVKWSAWGGSYVYTDSSFRDQRGDFDPDSKGISYRQQWPVSYLSANFERRVGNWSFSSSVQAGTTLSAKDTDDHWQRSLRFIDRFDMSPVLSVSASAEYAVNDRASFYVSGSADRIFSVRGDTREIDESSGDTALYKDAAGGAYESVLVSFGVKTRF